MKHYYVYILSSHLRAIYIGVTNNLERRVLQHKDGTGSKFTKRYNINRLVYYETFNNPNDAIAREKQLKKGTRKRKVALVNIDNAKWKDLSDEWS